jgi:hypothetical protein
MNAIILKGAALRQPPLPQSGPLAKTIAHPLFIHSSRKAVSEGTFSQFIRKTVGIEGIYNLSYLVILGNVVAWLVKALYY